MNTYRFHVRPDPRYALTLGGAQLLTADAVAECLVGVVVRELQETPSGQLIDLGLGGCYVKIPPPFLAGTLLDVVLRVKQVRVRIEGQVAAVQPHWYAN